MDFAALAQQCAPNVELITMQALAKTESSFNPYAIGVVGGKLSRQPDTLGEALATVKQLDAQGYDYSTGMMQVNKRNWKKYGLTHQTAFDLCLNMRAGAAILHGCFYSARKKWPQADAQSVLGAAFSCYNSGNFRSGYSSGYVSSVVRNAAPSRPSSARSAVAPVLIQRETQAGGRLGATARVIVSPPLEGVSQLREN